MSTRADRRPAYPPPTGLVTAVGVLMALWCVGFAAVSVWIEATDHFADGEYADYASGFSVANWLVTVIKVGGSVLALLAVARRPRFPGPGVVGTLLWAAFATTGIYVLGSLVQAVLMLTGQAGDADRIDGAAVAYVALFALAAVGFGVLAVSYARRAGLGNKELALGAIGAPILLGGLLVALPALLVALGLFPAS
ncbi:MULTISPECIES: hypothetical protein [unclassified Nocardioides]|uniref:hypothetical protein n=1 Tax=unclassified Nocardioides TaxID=2615069 RepID=UPI0012E3C928|nr:MULTISPECIES: hypothetical protein [unclassified Nocardioides]